MNSIQEPTWQIVFKGKLMPGFIKAAVIKDIEQNFPITRERLEYIFSGDRVVLRQNIPQSQIKEVEQRFRARGLDIELEREIVETRETTEAVVDKTATIQVNTWQIVFNGELMPGFVKAAVIKDIRQNFPISDERLAQIFSGNRVVLKQNIPQAQIEEVAQKFRARGLDISLELETPEPVILGKVAATERDKTDELLDRSQYSAPKTASIHQGRVDKFHTIDPAPAYYDSSLSGRMGRMTFINASLSFLIVFTLVIELVLINPTLREFNKLLPLAIFFPFSLFTTFYLFRLAALRFHDFKVNEWLAILYVIPITGLFISLFSRLGLFKYAIFIELGKQINHYSFYPSLLLFIILFLVLSFMPGSKRKNNYGNKVASGSIVSTALLIVGLVILQYYLKDDLALTKLFEFRIDSSGYRLF